VNNLGRRIERLEEKLGKNREPRVIVITINPDDLPENRYTAKISSGGQWAFAIRGGPFTDEEIRELKENAKG
jgi:hypothetical protein